MTGRGACAVLTIALAGTALGLAQPDIASPGLVTLDVAVVDDHGRTVPGLTREAFGVREDGRPVRLAAVRAVSAGANGARRVVALVLDDANIVPTITVNVQTIARAFLARMNDADAVSVIRFSRPDDEVAGNRAESLTRIAEFRGGLPIIGATDMFSYTLRRIAKLSRDLAAFEGGRRIIVGIGAPAVFDMNEPTGVSSSVLGPPWADTMRALARTNTSVYLVAPGGLVGSRYLRGAGLVEDTGGTAFVNSNDFEGAVDRIWSEAGHYYLLDYAPTAPERAMHSIDLTVRGRGLHAHVRRFRGDYHPPAS